MARSNELIQLKWECKTTTKNKPSGFEIYSQIYSRAESWTSPPQISYYALGDAGSGLAQPKLYPSTHQRTAQWYHSK